MSKTDNISIEMEYIDKIPPKMVFIVPYRDRPIQLDFFKRHMKYILEDIPKKDYKIMIMHQCDNRSFNRGALKNMGFMIIRELYPTTYQNITLIFNDLDTMPFIKNFLPYDTVPNTIKHFYGVPFTLGGIFSIKAIDFEKINGFPNFWAWGYEDNLINTRAKRANMNIDRSVFYPMHDINIIHLNDGTMRNVNYSEFRRYEGKTREGISSISQISYKFDVEYMVNVSHFNTGILENITTRGTYDLRNGATPFRPKMSHKNAQMKM
jgi:hypothetical protein